MSQYVINSPLFLNTINSGVVIPRLTTAQKYAISSPQAGTLVFDTSLADFQFFNGNGWISSGYGLTGGNYVSTNTDAFGRLRVSNPTTMFESVFRYGDNGKFDTYLTGNATGYVDNASATYLATISAANSEILRQSYNLSPYQPGKSLLVICSLVCSSTSYGETGLTQEVGYFDTNNGIFLRVKDEIVYMCIRNNGVDEAIPQNAWNVDTLSGTGPSQITLDITKAQIFYTDLEWLGVGTVEVGFVINGGFVAVHRFQHANISNSTYMGTACLPIRYHIAASGAYTGTSATLKQICSTVISEGGFTPYSTKYYINLGLTTPTVSTTLIPLISIRMQSSQLGKIVIPAQTDLIPLGNATLQYQLIYGGTLTGGSWVDVGRNSVVQYNTGASAISGGRVIDFGYVSSSSQSKSVLSNNGPDNFNIQLGRTITGDSEILSLCAVTFSGSSTVSAAIGWYEIS